MHFFPKSQEILDIAQKLDMMMKILSHRDAEHAGYLTMVALPHLRSEAVTDRYLLREARTVGQENIQLTSYFMSRF